jgi:hypothetical protein
LGACYAPNGEREGQRPLAITGKSLLMRERERQRPLAITEKSLLMRERERQRPLASPQQI